MILQCSFLCRSTSQGQPVMLLKGEMQKTMLRTRERRKEKKRRSRELSEWHRGRESERKADYKESIAQVEDRQRDWTQRGDRNKDKSGKRTDEAKEVSRGRDRGAGRTW